jgi:hypothetical protein
MRDSDRRASRHAAPAPGPLPILVMHFAVLGLRHRTLRGESRPMSGPQHSVGGADGFDMCVQGQLPHPLIVRFGVTRTTGTGRYRAFARVESRRRMRFSLYRRWAAADDRSRRVLAFGTSSANRCYQGTPAARPKTRRGQVRVESVRSTARAQRLLAFGCRT